MKSSRLATFVATEWLGMQCVEVMERLAARVPAVWQLSWIARIQPETLV